MTTRFASVVIDAAQPGVLAHWWAEAIGWPVTFIAPDEVVVEPAGNGQSYDVPALVFVPVDDPKTTKNRIHLDLASDSVVHQAELVERLVGSGATHADIGQSDVPWIVLADPEGNEFCVLEPRDRHIGRGPIASIVVDAVDPNAVARFWVAASGWPIFAEQEGGVTLHNPRGLLPDLDFVPVADAKSTKNRVHLDVAPYEGEDHAAEIARLVALGAEHIDVGQGPDVTWVVLADPEGNEFCVLRPRGIPPAKD
ncbi:MAG TPA: VOC family protein [Ilumatobacteraceae bacterium]|nr:VOC family protein [Ilumatobacteraceae bacterium]